MRLAEGGGGWAERAAAGTPPPAATLPDVAVTTGVLKWGVVVMGLIPANEVRAELGTDPSSPEGRPGERPGERERDS